MEGQSSLALRHNELHDPPEVIEHVARCDPQDRKAGPLKISLAQGVDACLISELVRRAINLNQEARRQTGKVRNITADRMLAAELVTFRPGSKGSPQ